LLTSFSSLAQIAANDDTFSVVYGANQVIAGDFLLNDTLNGSQAISSNVAITIISSNNSGISISGSNIVVAGGTPQGTYTLVYQICQVGSPTNCDTATVTINTELLAQPDNLQVSICGYYAGNILGSGTNLNYVDTLNGVPAVLTPYYSQPGNVLHPATVTLTYTQIYPGININQNGDVTVDYFSVGMGNYILTYQLCEIANPNNCSTGYATLNITPEFIYGSNDDFTSNPIDNTVGGTTLSVFLNDFSECHGNLNEWNAIVSAYNIPPGLTLNPDGTITVAVGTSPGYYLINYNACLINGVGCAYATATVAVTGVSTVVANYDYFGTNYPNSTTASVLNNDTFNGAPITSIASITISPLNLPSGFTLNPDGTITIGASVPEGTYAVPYQICNNASAMDCYVNYAYVVVFKNRILGKVKFDANSNGCDAGDAYLNYINVKT